LQTVICTQNPAFVMNKLDPEKSAVDTVRKDPNFVLIAVGAAIWFLGYYVLFFRPVIVAGGFLLTCYATAVSALNRPVVNAWPGMLLGAAFFALGDFLTGFLPISLAAVLFVPGTVLMLFFAIPLAIQRGNAPLAEALQRVTKGSTKKKEEKPAEDKK